jgi:hypothetical protein
MAPREGQGARASLLTAALILLQLNLFEVILADLQAVCHDITTLLLTVRSQSEAGPC